MKLLFLLGSFFLLNYPLRSFAQNSKSYVEDDKKDDQVEVKDLPSSHHEVKKNFNLTSRESREEKQYEGMLGFGYESTQLAGSVAVGKFLNPSNILHLKFATASSTTSSTTSLSGDTTATKSYEEKINHFSLSWKTFLGNSFYLKPSIGYIEFAKRNTLEAIIDSIFGQETPMRQLNGYTLGAAIGNQWINKEFTFGCEWLGVNRVVYATKKENEPNRTLPVVTYVYIGIAF